MFDKCYIAKQFDTFLTHSTSFFDITRSFQKKMEDNEKRKQAISLYRSGEIINRIVKSLNKSRQWFYFWLDRYQSAKGKGDWFKGEQKAPKTKPNKVSSETERQVILARKQLDKQRHAQTGSIAIQYKMHSTGLGPPPLWTINRILTRHGMV